MVLFIPIDHQGVTFESQESTTADGGSVYNQIKWWSFPDKDVWMMRQSHHGIQSAKDKWDRLAIVIDKTQRQKTARFFQFEPGELEWKEGMKPAPFRASCFMCHSNGPRAIRPKWDSKSLALSLKNRIKIFMWNLKIKSYGKVDPHPDHENVEKKGGAPFRWPGGLANQTLKVKACTKCHKEQGLFARNTLKRQQVQTIKFMLDKGYMPPPGFSISPLELKQVEAFTMGF